ncbi:hypothetical protein K502DRAFT_353665 [Neoconidiobolus thromboides FSU 785]|nr:hypothetical protein K502DRAFT_353665 [Neoconidiobolus thromboides FSU 785]
MTGNEARVAKVIKIREEKKTSSHDFSAFLDIGNRSKYHHLLLLNLILVSICYSQENNENVKIKQLLPSNFAYSVVKVTIRSFWANDSSIRVERGK